MKARKIFLSLGSLAALASCGIIAGTTTSCSKNITPEDEEKLMLAVIRQDTQLQFSSNLEDPSGTPADVWYKIKKETEWNKLEGGQTVNFTAGQTVYFKGNNPDGFCQTKEGAQTELIRQPRLCFSSGSVDLDGTVMALLNNGSGENVDAIPNPLCFYGTFRHSQAIESVANNFLPATTLVEFCYTNMFYNCTSLTTAPDLPATTLPNHCYYGMFWNCTSLTTVPAELPAITLADGCYSDMFEGCISLTTAPLLPAITLADGCYDGMFQGCSQLSTIKIYYKGNFDTTFFSQWVNGVAANGTFYYNGSDTTRGTSAIPGTESTWLVKRF